MTMRGLVRLAVAAVLAPLIASCDLVGPGEPLVNPGPVLVVLATPRQDDGALMFSVSGGPVDSITAGEHRLYAAALAPDAQRAIVTGELIAGPVATLWVPDRNVLSTYTVTLEQAVVRGSYAQSRDAGYALTLVVP